jgi:peptidoglycan/LPS O-acetylase OafA/YrhL
LAVEEHFYLLFPLFVIGMRGNTRRMAATLSLLMIFILGWRIVALTWWHPPRFYLDYATESRIDAIAGGCLISCAFKEQTAHRIRAIMTTQGRKVLVSALAILCAAVLIRNPFFRETGRYTLESIGSMVLVLAVVYAENTNSFVRKFLRNKIMTFIGKTSYAAYLYHLFIYQILTMLLPSSSFIWIFLAVLISLSAATASFYLVEKPLKPLRRRFGSHVRG